MIRQTSICSLCGVFLALTLVTAPQPAAAQTADLPSASQLLAANQDGDQPLAQGEQGVDHSQATDQPETADQSQKQAQADSEELAHDTTARQHLSDPPRHVDGEGEKARIERLRNFLTKFSDEDEASSETIARLREVGSHLTSSQSPHLPLQPYVVDPRWNEAMQMLDDGDCEDALELATEVLGPPEVNADAEPGVAYAFARMQMCGGERSAGRATMQELAELPDAVGILAQKALGRSANSDIDDDARSLNAHIADGQRLARDGQVDQALEQLRELREGLSGGWDRHRVRLAEARIMEDAGLEEEAAMAYLGIYRKTRSWRSSNNIARQIEEAEKRMDREIIPFGDRIDRMRGLIARGRYRHAQQVSRENAQIRGVSGTEIRGWTRYRQALQNERQRNRERAASQFEEAEKLVKDDAIRPRLYFGWARALRRTGGDTEAIELYERLCDEYPKNHLCDYALYEAGRLLQYQNEHERAREFFAEVVGMHPFSEHVPDALWRYALSAYLQEDYAAAIAPLEQIVQFYGDIQDASELTIGLKARYWIGVNHLQLGDKEQARTWLQNTIDHGPLTWYGRLAATRLEDAGLPAHVRLPTARLSKDRIEEFATLRLPDNPRLAVAAELARIGLYSEALAEVRRQQGVHPEPEGAVQLRAALHLAVDEPNWAHWIMKSVIGEEGPTHRTLRDWGFAFPLNYFDLSHRHAEDVGVSPFLVQAIMRQESGFRPRVSSHAGAMGLMQLMPGTARYTARTFFEGQRLTNQQILDEDTNVRLGTMYIRIHIAHAADHPSMALAGYNAGPGALQSWFERYGDREIDAFVESITYRETRGYVRKVMTSYITYQGLYGDGDLPHIEIQLPDELRQWGTVPELDDVEEGEPVSMVF